MFWLLVVLGFFCRGVVGFGVVKDTALFLVY